MRIKIELYSNKDFNISFNYNLALTSIIYKFLNKSDYDFSSFLHNKGYKKDKHFFKLFTFSNLNFKSLGINNNKLRVKKGKIFWYISSPIDVFVTNLVNGLFNQNNEIILENNKLIINKVEILSVPNFTEKEKFKMMCPLIVSTKQENKNKELKIHYFRYNENFDKQLLKNLKRKYYLINGKESNCNELKLKFDETFLKYKNYKVSKLIHFVKWDKNKSEYIDIKVKGIFCPFTIETNPELIKVGYECGFGEKNSTGFGMVDFVH